MKRRYRLLALCLCFALLLGCLPTVSAAENIETNQLEALKEDLISSGRIEQDELENYINKLISMGITEPDKLEDFINAFITDKEMREEGRKEVLKYAEEVDETVRTKICKDYYAQHEALHSSRELEDVFIRKYYGCYNGVHVVRMDVIGKLYTCDELELNIDNLIFDFPSGGCEAMFLAYHEGVFTRVADAFAQGLLKKSDLLSMLKIHYENRSYLPVGATEPIAADEFEIIINARIAAQKAKEAAEAQAMADEAAADAKASAETAQAAAEAAAAEVAENKAAAKAAQKAAAEAEAAAEAAATAAAEADAVAAEKAAATAAAAAEAAKAQAAAQFAQAKAEAAMKAAEEAQAKADEAAAVAKESEEAYRAQEAADNARKAVETAAEAAGIAADAAAEGDDATAKAAAEVAKAAAEAAYAMKETASLMAEKVKNKVDPPEIPVIPKPPVIPEPPNPLTAAKSQALMQLHVTAYEAFANLGEVFKEEAEKLIEDSVAAIEAAKTVREVDAALMAALKAIANFCPSKDFADVPAVGSWAHEGIDYAVASGLMEGTGEGIFNPKGTLTRAMLATVLWRSQGEPASHPSSYFTDVAEGSWYANAVAWAHHEGIVYGTGGSNFSPNDAVTRETFATMLYRLSGADEAPQEKNPTWDFEDLSTVSSWAKDAVDWAIEEGVLQGIEKEDGYYLNPGSPITRAEAATMLMRYMEGA